MSYSFELVTSRRTSGIRTDLVTEAEEKVRVIQENLKAAQSRQKSYFDKRRDPLQFEVGDHVYLRVSPTKGVQRFGVKGKLAPRYVGPYEITEICGPVAYRVRLPPRGARIRGRSRACMSDPIIPALKHRIPSELRSLSVLGRE